MCVVATAKVTPVMSDQTAWFYFDAVYKLLRPPYLSRALTDVRWAIMCSQTSCSQRALEHANQTEDQELSVWLTANVPDSAHEPPMA